MFENTNWKAVSAEIMGTFFLVFFLIFSFPTTKLKIKLLLKGKINKNPNK